MAQPVGVSESTFRYCCFLHGREPDRLESWCFKEEAEKKAYVGLFEEAITLTQNISDKVLRSLSYMKIAEIMTYPRFNKLEKAQELAALALGDAETLEYQDQKDLHLHEIAIVFALAQKFSASCETAEKIHYVFMKAGLLTKIANIMIDAHDSQGAMKVTTRAQSLSVVLKDPSWIPEAVAQLVDRLNTPIRTHV